MQKPTKFPCICKQAYMFIFIGCRLKLLRVNLTKDIQVLIKTLKKPKVNGAIYYAFEQ